MKRKLLFLLLIILPGILFAQNPDSSWVKAHYIKKEEYIKMRDGVRLFTTIYEPADMPGKHPILMVRTPYSCAPYGKDKWIPSFWNNYLGAYLKRGYCFVLQDVRGRYMSEGAFVNIRPFNPNKKTNKDIDEASDTYDTIDWLIKNIPNNNGKVGVLGVSYPGFYAAMAALSGHPALKAVLPEAPVTDWFMGDDLHHNGAFMLQDAFSFYAQFGFGNPRPRPKSAPDKEVEQPVFDSYKYFLDIGPLPEFTKLTGDSIAFWKDLMAHPNYDAWWKARNDRQYMSLVPSNMPTLVVGGLFDAEDMYGAWNLYRAIERKAKNNNRIIMGPWYHGQWSGNKGDHLGDVYWGSNTGDWYIKNIELPYFDYYLLGKGNMDTLSEATIFITGENKWHRFKQWPPISEKPKSLYLADAKSLNFSAPSAQGLDQYTSDPSNPVPYNGDLLHDRTREYMDADQRFASERKDVLTYQTEPLKSDITLTGPITADLWTSISTTDADFVVKVIDVFPAGGNNSPKLDNYEMLVRGDIIRGKFRHSFEKPEAFTPGKKEEIKFIMPDVAHTFKKGHRIMIQVQSSWFPLVDRNPQQFEDIYHAKKSDFIKSEIKIYHSPNYPSRIILPVLNE